MYKLLFLSFSILFSVGLNAQQSNLSGSDDKLTYEVKVEKLADEKNDRFYSYYSLEIKNTSNSAVTFTPVFNYTNENGVKRNSTTHDDKGTITLAPGQSIKGNIDTQRNLTLFKEFNIGNSGKKSSNDAYTLNSVSINY